VQPLVTKTKVAKVSES